ncbi:hypothetical protein JOB18_017937 [Solea senegalensis]|uniref:Mucin-17-like isoform X1 n=1 Tax=Solea senegalensis TaxID=28829 RepID=A0AAV6Q8S4_SOLSE|nr:mucin-17-like isoform X1 [Solea senegalensis]KAG7485771.1 hypothetical protein JOB18_017937 [Solea senegalensis]KAG7485772.1 hypothetical protein JOB18_017937 [Solea senegalensis]
MCPIRKCKCFLNSTAQSFPCKFFHKKGKCLQGAQCKFSHEPLNDTTKRLLDETLKRDSELYELAKKAEQELSEQPEKTTEIPEITREKRTSDALMHPLKPNFYNSAETNTEADVAAQAPDSSQPHSHTCAHLNPEEPVCYSVEAVLGPQLLKPFPSLSAPENSSDCAPYSVEAVLSCQSAASSIPASSPAQSVLYTPLRADPLMLSYSHSSRGKATQCQENLFKVPETKLPVDNEDHKKHVGAKVASMKPAQRWSDEVKLDMAESESCTRKRRVQGSSSLPVKCKDEAEFKSTLYCPARPSQLTPRVSGQTSDSQSSPKPHCPSSGFSQFKCRAARPIQPVSSYKETSDSETQPQLKIPRYSVRPGNQQQDSTGVLSTACNQTQKRPFHSLFANPINDGLKPTPPSPLRSTPPRRKDKGVKNEAEPVRSFLSTLAAPLSPAATPQRDTTHDKRAPENESELLSEAVGRDAEQQVSLTCGFMSAALTELLPSSTTQAQQHKCDTGPAAPAEPSVLKSLFLCLSPFEDDRQQNVPPPVSEKEQNSTGEVSVQQ